MLYLRLLIFFGVVIKATTTNLEPGSSNQPPKPSIPESVVKPALMVEPAAVKPAPIVEAAAVQPALVVKPAAGKPSLMIEPADKKNPGSNSMITLPASELNDLTNVIKNLNVTDLDDFGWNFENRTPIDTRRILFGTRSKPGKRAYMVYLQLTSKSAKAAKYKGWLCGGVVVHKNYVLTSAACVEDADRFYIVSGTTKYVDAANFKNDDCVCKHRRKVVWKCIPKNYKFDFQDSQKWSANDIAVVKVNKPFCFGEIEAGCEFAVQKVCYNNVSRDLEKPGTKGWIAGWGSNGGFREGVYRRSDDDDGEARPPKNAKCLQEAKVCIMDNARCAKKWSKKYKDIIKEYMVCTKDIVKQLSEVCNKKYANCSYVETGKRRQSNVMLEPPPKNSLTVDFGRHLRDPEDYTARRFNSAGFCENDHGGPLIVKYANKDRVIGVISACKIDPKTHSCHGPFLYTSVFVNRQFISCAINKDIEGCKRVFRAGVTHEEWPVNWEGEERVEIKGSKTERPEVDKNNGDDKDNEDEKKDEKEKKQDKDDEDEKKDEKEKKEDKDDDDGDKVDSDKKKTAGKSRDANEDDEDKEDKADPGPPKGAEESSVETLALRSGNRDANSTAPTPEPSTPEPEIKTGKVEPLKPK